jgi:integrating conjugative element protein (TIGR03765 family)
MIKRLCPLLAVSALSMGGVCHAESMSILIDYGNTRPSGLPTLEEIERLAKEINTEPSELVSFTPYVFPVKPEIFHLGVLENPISHSVKHVKKPFIVIGADNTSREWLIRNKDHLRKMGVTSGVVTSAETADDFKAINDVADAIGISLDLMESDTLTEFFNVDVYPILITEKEILQ